MIKLTVETHEFRALENTLNEAETALRQKADGWSVDVNTRKRLTAAADNVATLLLRIAACRMTDKPEEV